MENKFCPKCGSKQEGNKFCSNCGNQLSQKLEERAIRDIKKAASEAKESVKKIIDNTGLKKSVNKIKGSVNDTISKENVIYSEKNNSKKNSFWQRFNTSKETENFLKGGKYFLYFVGLCFIVDLVFRPLAGGNETSLEFILSNLFMGFFASFGYSLLFLIVGNIKRNEFKTSVVEGGVGCSTILLLIFTIVGIWLALFS